MSESSQKISLKKFKFSLIKGFLFATPVILVTNHLMGTLSAIFASEKKITNYEQLLPEKLREITGTLNKWQFISLGLIWVFFYAFFYYLDLWYEKKLIIRVSDYTKNRLLKKFRRLGLEDKVQKKEEINSLVEIESNIFSEHLVKLANSLYKGLLSILLFFKGVIDAKPNIKNISAPFGAVWVILVGLVIYFFFRLSFYYGKISKREISEEYGLINGEINNSVLIESMGLTSQYEKRQQFLTKKTQKNRIRYFGASLGANVIPWRLLINLFPFLVLIIDKDFIGAEINYIWLTLNHVIYQLSYLWNYADYSSSQQRINALLALPEKADHWHRLCLTAPIHAISFQQVSFKYTTSPQWVLANYSQTFTAGQLNQLTGANGSGKSTILYLLLGLLVPQQGRILVTTVEGQVYDLQQDLNLAHWRQQVVAYGSHNNLVEEGSTGQRQLANLHWLLTQKKTAQIFCLDEADNALDAENQKLVHTQLQQLATKKIIIYIK